MLLQSRSYLPPVRSVAYADTSDDIFLARFLDPDVAVLGNIASFQASSLRRALGSDGGSLFFCVAAVPTPAHYPAFLGPESLPRDIYLFLEALSSLAYFLDTSYPGRVLVAAYALSQFPAELEAFHLFGRPPVLLHNEFFAHIRSNALWWFSSAIDWDSDSSRRPECSASIYPRESALPLLRALLPQWVPRGKQNDSDETFRFDAFHPRLACPVSVAPDCPWLADRLRSASPKFLEGPYEQPLVFTHAPML